MQKDNKYCVQDSPIEELGLLDEVDVGPSTPGVPEPVGNRDRYYYRQKSLEF